VCLDLVRKSVFAAGMRDEPAARNMKIDVKNINTWRMEALVADSYVDSDVPSVFLAGDSAHAFPPSGGFGLNTGINDANNLAHKLAWALHNGDTSRLGDYDTERRLIGGLTKAYAIANYDKGIVVAAKLNLNKPGFDAVDSLINNFVPTAF